MAYVSHNRAEVASNQSTPSDQWADLLTVSIFVASGNEIMVMAGWHATAAVLAGAFRILVNDGSADTQIGKDYPAPLGTSSRTLCKEVTASVGAVHTVKLQYKAGSLLSSLSVDAEDAWLVMFNLST